MATPPSKSRHTFSRSHGYSANARCLLNVLQEMEACVPDLDVVYDLAAGDLRLFSAILTRWLQPMSSDQLLPISLAGHAADLR